MFKTLTITKHFYDTLIHKREFNYILPWKH